MPTIVTSLMRALFACLAFSLAQPNYAIQRTEYSPETCFTQPPGGQSSPISDKKQVVESIDIDPKPIFDEQAEDAIPLHRWANALHVITKPRVIKKRLPFDEGDSVNLEDIKEAEAILRRERFIADARIRLEGDCSEDGPARVKVTTYDNWSLIPTLSFSRSGGNNNTIIGIREDNLLGLGIRTRFRYNNDEQRSGYELAFSSAVPGIRHANVYLSLLDNDDGERYQFIFDKPFHHLGTERSYYAELFQDSRVDDIFQNGATRNSLAIEQEKYEVSLGWRLNSKIRLSERLKVGFTYAQSRFENDITSPSNDPLFVPANRNYQYPWIAYEWVERDIAVLQNINLIRQPEDINLGWQTNMLLGFELNDINDDSELAYHFRSDIYKGWSWGESLVLFAANARADLQTTAKDRLRLDLRGQYFHHFTETLGFYARLASTFSNGQFANLPVVVDDDNGVRGYPQQYQHGDQRISASVEARFYPGYSFYQLFDLGFAVFADVGRAFDGDAASFNEDEGTLASIGIGARLYSNKASNPGVVHIDFATPLSNGQSIDSWEWSIQMRRSF